MILCKYSKMRYPIASKTIDHSCRASLEIDISGPGLLKEQVSAGTLRRHYH